MRRDDDEVLCSVLADHSHTKSSRGKLLPNAPAAVKLDQSLPGRVLMSASELLVLFPALLARHFEPDRNKTE